MELPCFDRGVRWAKMSSQPGCLPGGSGCARDEREACGGKAPGVDRCGNEGDVNGAYGTVAAAATSQYLAAIEESIEAMWRNRGGSARGSVARRSAGGSRGDAWVKWSLDTREPMQLCWVHPDNRMGVWLAALDNFRRTFSPPEGRTDRVGTARPLAVLTDGKLCGWFGQRYGVQADKDYKTWAAMFLQQVQLQVEHFVLIARRTGGDQWPERALPDLNKGRESVWRSRPGCPALYYLHRARGCWRG